MNITDTKLLGELMLNSRISLTKLAKKLNISREVATYRINKLTKEKVILDFVAEINTEKLGFVGAAVFLNIKASKQKEFQEYLKTCNFVSWVAELSGVWNFGLSIYDKNNEELDKKFLTIYNKFKESIINHRFTLHKKSTFFYEKYFGAKRKQEIKKEVVYKADSKDKLILKELAKNSRVDYVELSKKIKLSAPAISNRIKKLKTAGYIKNYSTFVDISKIGLMQYSIFINNKIDEKEKLLAYLKEHKSISFVAEYMGNPFMEFGVFVNSPYKLREVLQEIEEAFPNNKIIEISLFQKEFVSVGPPSYVLE
ncbi:MAG: winged helix-turn-helix transcriptional regulator [archaeon]